MPFSQTKGCERVPVIYRYTDPDGEGPKPFTWEEVYRGEGRGYVGAVAWIGPGRALAVGGDGEYVRREPNAGSPDPAGRARAWLYEQGSWRELEGLPQAMRGMQALDCAPNERPGPREEHCVAGALRQLWHFRDGRFVKSYTSESPESEVEGRQRFRFRVREVRFVPDLTSKTVVAVTSGCCAAQEQLKPDPNVPRGLAFDGEKWSVSGKDDDSLVAVHARRPKSAVALIVVRPANSVTGARFWSTSLIFGPDGPAPDPPIRGEANSQVHGNAGIPPQPSLGGGAVNQELSTRVCVVVTFISQICTPEIKEVRVDVKDDPYLPTHDPYPRSTFRLTSGDGDDDPISWQRGTMDWAVGELTRTGQGLAYPTRTTNDDPGHNVIVPTTDVGDRGVGVSVPKSGGLWKLPSYALNSFDLVGDFGVGWAVGDKGAIVRLGRQDVDAAEPAPPKLGPGKPAAVPNSEPYDAFRPPPGTEPGVVPPLRARPIERFPEHRFVAAGELPRGSSVNQIVMSRDGSAGWALGGGMTLYRYDGLGWSRCRTDDPACEDLEPLREEGVSLIAMARVPPLEYDSDPTNDDELQLVALGRGRGVSGHRIIRYRERPDGQRVWRLDEAGSAQLNSVNFGGGLHDIAFTAPDDGWAVGSLGSQFATDANILRYNGSTWIRCLPVGALGSSHANCKDPDGRLPARTTESLGINPRGLRLAVAGQRVYLFGSRVGKGGSEAARVTTTSVFPIIIYRDPGGKWTAGYDPGCATVTPAGCVESTDPADQGRVFSLAVAERPAGGYDGWAVGQFGGTSFAGVQSGSLNLRVTPSSRELGDRLRTQKAAVLRLEGGPGGAGSWRRWQVGDAADDYLFEFDNDPAPRTGGTRLDPRQQLSLPAARGDVEAIMAPEGRPLLGFNSGHRRWQVLPTPFKPSAPVGPAPYVLPSARVGALAPDGQGGFWLTATSTGGHGGFYHYADSAPRPVFEDTPHPIPNMGRDGIDALAGAADGSLWIATDSAGLFRYDRLTG